MLETGELHLMIFSPSGNHRPHHNVMPGGEPGQWSPLA